MREPAFGIVICFGREGKFAVIEPPARVAAAPAPAEPPGGARPPSSSISVGAAPAPAEPAAPAGFPVACRDPHDDFEIAIGRWLVTAWAGLLASVSRAGTRRKGRI